MVKPYLRILMNHGLVIITLFQGSIAEFCCDYSGIYHYLICWKCHIGNFLLDRFQCCIIRGGSRTAATSKMERFVMIVKGFQPLTIVTKCSILDVVAYLDPPLIISNMWIESITVWFWSLQYNLWQVINNFLDANLL